MSTFLLPLLVLLLQGTLHEAFSKEIVSGATVKMTHRHLQEDDELIIEIGFLLSNVGDHLSAAEIVNYYEEDLNVAFDRALKESLEHDDNIFQQNDDEDDENNDPSTFSATLASRQATPQFSIETAEDGTTPIRYSCPNLLEHNSAKFLNAKYFYELLAFDSRNSHDYNITMTALVSYAERDLLVQLAGDVGMINGARCIIPPASRLWIVDVRSEPDDEIIEYLGKTNKDILLCALLLCALSSILDHSSTHSTF